MSDILQKLNFQTLKRAWWPWRNWTEPHPISGPTTVRKKLVLLICGLSLTVSSSCVPSSYWFPLKAIRLRNISAVGQNRVYLYLVLCFTQMIENASVLLTLRTAMVELMIVELIKASASKCSCYAYFEYGHSRVNGSLGSSHPNPNACYIMTWPHLEGAVNNSSEFPTGRFCLRAFPA